MSNSRKIVVLVPPLLIGLTVLLVLFTYRYMVVTNGASAPIDNAATRVELPIEDERATLPATSSIPILREEREVVMCPQDVRECADGSFVNRVPPNCTFELCPSELEGIELVPD